MECPRIARLFAGFLAFSAIAFAQVQIKPLLGLEGQTSSPSLSPDGRTLAFEWRRPSGPDGIYTRPLEDGTPTLVAGQDGKDGLPVDPVWSPDGRSLAFSWIYSRWDRHLFVRNMAAGAIRDLGPNCGTVTWTPDNRFIVTGALNAEDCRLSLVSAESGQRVRQWAFPGEVTALSPNGKALAFGEGGILKLLRLTSAFIPAGAPVAVARERREISSITWEPGSTELFYKVNGDSPVWKELRPGGKSRLLAGASSDFDVAQILAGGTALATEFMREETLWQLDLNSGHPKIARAPDNTDPLLSPDGHRTAYIAAPNGLAEIWVANADRTSAHVLVKSFPAFSNPPTDAVPSHLAWSPDGRWLAFTTFGIHGNGDVRSWLYIVPSAGGPLRRLAAEAVSVWHPVWAEDGKSILAGAVTDPGARTQLARIDAASGSVRQISDGSGIWGTLSSNGEFLYYFSMPGVTPGTMLCRVRAASGVEEPVAHMRGYNGEPFAAGKKYVYLFRRLDDAPKPAEWQLVQLDPETKQEQVLAEVPFSPRSAFLSRDGGILYFSQVGDTTLRAVSIRGLQAPPVK